MPVPRYGGGQPKITIPAGSRFAAPPGRYHKQGQIPTIPMQLYRSHVSITLAGDNARSGVVTAAGTVTLQCGPQGVGERWVVTMAAISTTVGAADLSTATVYAGSQGVASVVAAQSYAGGGDTAGLNSAELTPGQYVIAMWAGGTPGSIATLVVYGTKWVLSP